MKNNVFLKGVGRDLFFIIINIIKTNKQTKTKKGWGNVSRLKEAKEIWQLNSIPTLCSEKGKML